MSTLSKKTELIAIDQALDAISWDWLSTTHPLLAEAVQTDTRRGAEPDQILRFVMKKTERLELALRCQQAARHLVTSDL